MPASRIIFTPSVGDADAQAFLKNYMPAGMQVVAEKPVIVTPEENAEIFAICGDDTPINLVVEDGIVVDCKFIGGCRGNTNGLAKLCVGRTTEDLKALLKGIPCRGNTSCPDQVVCAIEAYEAEAK